MDTYQRYFASCVVAGGERFDFILEALNLGQAAERAQSTVERECHMPPITVFISTQVDAMVSEGMNRPGF